ncbi:MAG: hypothetical protein LBC78_01270 [Oscillospiraceae bacterium]|jgi:hypothetical protein|nr:hypothetical protein [Oscillospiraceae bacterium]
MDEQKNGFEPTQSDLTETQASGTAEMVVTAEPESADAVEAPAEGSVAGGSKKKARRIFFAAGAFVVVAAAIWVGVTIAGATLARTVAKMENELSRRLDTTVFGHLETFGDASKDGSYTIDFAYKDEYGEEYSGRLVAAQNAKANAARIALTARAYGVSADLDLLLNAERIAFGSTLIDESYYGFKYDTFAQDFLPFAELIGLDDETRELIIEYIDYLGGSMKTSAADSETLKNAIDKAVKEFYAAAEKETGTAEIVYSQGTKRAKFVMTTFTGDDAAKLVDDIFTAVRNLPSVKELDALSFTIGAEDYGKDYDAMLSGLKAQLAGTYSVTYYIVSGRVALIGVSAQPDAAGADIQMRLDLGKSWDDTWSITVINVSGTNAAASLAGEYNYDSSHVNTITLSENGEDVGALVSYWTEKTGAFDLIIRDTEYPLGKAGVSGTLKNEKGHAELAFTGNDALSLVISADLGAEIPNPEFVNIDKWDEDFLMKLQEAVLGLLFSANESPGIS